MTTRAMPAGQAVDEPAADRVRGCCNDLPPLLADDRAARLAALHAALGDPMRVQIVRLIAAASAPVCICDLTAALPLSQPTISHHVARLRDAGVVRSRRAGIWSFHELDPAMPRPARDAVGAILEA